MQKQKCRIKSECDFPVLEITWKDAVYSSFPPISREKQHETINTAFKADHWLNRARIFMDDLLGIRKKLVLVFLTGLARGLIAGREPFVLLALTAATKQSMRVTNCLAIHGIYFLFMSQNNYHSGKLMTEDEHDQAMDSNRFSDLYFLMSPPDLEFSWSSSQFGSFVSTIAFQQHGFKLILIDELDELIRKGAIPRERSKWGPTTIKGKIMTQSDVL